MATPTHAGRARLCRAHVCHPPALPGTAEPSRRPYPRCALGRSPQQGAALHLQLLHRGQPRPTVCPGPGQDWGSCVLCWEGTSACGSNTCCEEEEEESDPGAGNRPGPLSWVHTTPVAKGSVWLS